MPRTEAKKAANYRYNVKTYTTLGCRVRKDEAEMFRKACEAAGTSPNAVFRAAMIEFMGGKTLHRPPAKKKQPEDTYDPSLEPTYEHEEDPA